MSFIKCFVVECESLMICVFICEWVGDDVSCGRDLSFLGSSFLLFIFLFIYFFILICVILFELGIQCNC